MVPKGFVLVMALMLSIALVPTAFAMGNGNGNECCKGNNCSDNVCHDDTPHLPDQASQVAKDKLNELKGEVIEEMLQDKQKGLRGYSDVQHDKHSYTNPTTQGESSEVHIATKHHELTDEFNGVIGSFEFDYPEDSTLKILGVNVPDRTYENGTIEHRDHIHFPDFPLVMPSEGNVNKDDSHSIHTELFYSVSNYHDIEHDVPVKIYYELDGEVYSELDHITFDRNDQLLEVIDLWIDRNVFDEYGQLHLFGFTIYEK